jgi:alpha-1,3-mannosyltransferase
MLRLFNDTIVMLFIYAAINLWLSEQWSIGCIIFRYIYIDDDNICYLVSEYRLKWMHYYMHRHYCAFYWLDVVCIEQLLTYVYVQLYRYLSGTYYPIFDQICIAFPFIIIHPLIYIQCAFNFGRIFMHKWTVNWRFISESIFIDRRLHIALLGVHLGLLAIFASRKWLR